MKEFPKDQNPVMNASNIVFGKVDARGNLFLMGTHILYTGSLTVLPECTNIVIT